MPGKTAGCIRKGLEGVVVVYLNKRGFQKEWKASDPGGGFSGGR